MSRASRSDSSERLLTAAEVAAIYGVHPKSVNRWAARGIISATRTPGGHLRFVEWQVRIQLEGSKQPAST